jgi:hypothetical protein
MYINVATQDRAIPAHVRGVHSFVLYEYRSLFYIPKT